MPAYTKRVNKTIKSFKRSTTRYTKADNILCSTNSHFLKKEVKSKQKHPRCRKRSGQGILPLIGLKLLIIMTSLQNIATLGAQGLLMLMGSKILIK